MALAARVMFHSFFSLLLIFCTLTSRASRCRNNCGPTPINYPFGLDDGCGSPFLRRIITCSVSGELYLRTPSGTYPVINISYTGESPHILISDRSAWSCHGGGGGGVPFSLDSSIPLRLSPLNNFLFFNCSEKDVIMEPKPVFCRRFPEQCDSTCDTASYLCRRLPECGGGRREVAGGSCCAYSPKGSESLRIMLRHCVGYAGVYWRNVGSEFQVPAYGMRVDFDFPMTRRCRRCQDSGGSCGFNVNTQVFSCLCRNTNSTAYCRDRGGQAVMAGTLAGASVAGGFAGAGIWYLRKLRAKASVNHGVQTNENRLF